MESAIVNGIGTATTIYIYRNSVGLRIAGIYRSDYMCLGETMNEATAAVARAGSGLGPEV